MGKTVVLSALILFLLLGLFHFPVPVYRDHTFLHFPTWEVAAKSGGVFFPLSNPFLNHGAPLASDPNNLLLYPTAWLLKILTAQQAYSLHFFGHALLSFWLMAFLFMERLEKRKALILAAFWIFSGPFLSAAGSLNLFTTFCWVPGIFLAARRGSVPGQVLALSMAALAGEPVIGLTAAILVFFYTINWKRTAQAMAVTGILFLPLFLFLHKAFAFSTKMAGGLTFRTALNASLQPERLLEAVFPFALGVPGTKAPWVSFTDPVRWLLPTLAIAWLFFFLFERNRKNLILIAALLFFALGGFNTVVKFAYERIPSLALIRFPEKLFLMVGFLLMWQAKDRVLNLRWLRWLGLLIIPAFFMSPMTGILTALCFVTLMLWARGLLRWGLAAGVAAGLLTAFYAVPLSSDLYSFQGPEQRLLDQLTSNGRMILDQRDPLRIPVDVRERYREQRKYFGLRIEPPVKEAYYLRRRLLLAPSGMGLDVHYAFVEDVSGSGSVHYAMVRELLPKMRDQIAEAYGIAVVLEDHGSPGTAFSPSQWPFVFSDGVCSPDFQSMVRLWQGTFFGLKDGIMIAGDCPRFHHASATWKVSHDGTWHISSPEGAVLGWPEVYSPLKIQWIDGVKTKPTIAFGSLLALRIPPGDHAIEARQPLPATLTSFLVLFYTMFLAVFLTWSLKSLSRRTTKNSA